MRPASAIDAAPDLVVQRPQGLYCPAGDSYIDPWRPVDRDVITHARPLQIRLSPLKVRASWGELAAMHQRANPIRAIG